MTTDTSGTLTQRLSDHIARISSEPLPPEVHERAKLHLLDTLAAIASGASLESGKRAIRFVAGEGASEDSTIIGSGRTGTASDAALANGMSAHADETDDSHQPSHTHPGCAVVPAALAVAEREHCSGEELLRAVAIGYEINCRAASGLGIPYQRGLIESKAVGGTFGAAAAAGVLCRLSAQQIPSLLSYAAQQAWGLSSHMRSANHVEKAFVFAGRGSRDGVLAATMVQRGFDGVPDVFDGAVNYYDAVAPNPNPAALLGTIGDRWEILRTNIKRYPVGSPIQAIVEGLRRIIAANPVDASKIQRVEIRLPTAHLEVVDNRHMPDVNAQYIASVTLLDGGLSYASAHDHERMTAPEVLAMRARIELVGDPDMTDTTRHARLRVEMTDGAAFSEYVSAVRGTADNPMLLSEVEEKARELIVPVTGEEMGSQLIERFMRIEELADVRELRPLLLAVRSV